VTKNMSEQAKDKISAIARRLKLPVLAEFNHHISNDQSFTANLLQLLELEALEKENRGIQRRTKSAGFPLIRMLDAFEFDAKRMPYLHKEQVWEVAECDFIKEKRNVLAIGNSGMGKTFLSIAFGIEAIRRGFTVRFRRASDLVNQMSEAQNEQKLSRFIKSLNNCDLLICDELGYLNFDLHGASLLFQVFAARYEVSSTMITSNQEFSKWPLILGNDQAMSTALVDRLIHRAEILNMNGDSYRLHDAKSEIISSLSGGMKNAKKKRSPRSRV